ncbi:MAG: OmpA family protein [Bacteroidetes bacterium]|nr:OmpA family protein [Bacteroidota bacterium]MBS1756998.1 OmpA family protein [Bacteroidota bacterium]
MKKIIAGLTFSLLLFLATNAQSTVEQAKQRAITDVNNNTGTTIDKTVNGAFDQTGKAIGNIFKKKSKKKNTGSDPANPANPTNTDAIPGNNSNNTPVNNGTTPTNTSAVNAGAATSDFVPGQNIIFQDDFSQDALSDFPAKWNSNGSGKIITLNNLSGRWLELKTSTAITPMLNTALPENCTIEFDLYLDAQGAKSTPFIKFGFTEVKNILKEDMYYKDRFFMNIARYTEEDSHQVEYGLQNDVLGSKGDFPITSYANKILHVSIALNKARVRIYLDQTKVVDLPQAITPNMRNNFFLLSNTVIPPPDLDMYVGNIRIASAETDARSLLIKQLMNEGKAVTSDILFDVNSDVIKSESYPVVNQFGDALKANPDLKIKINGHTDSDGNAGKNITLSKKRADAVKKYLVANYGIASVRIQTDGKGATQPVADNSTAEGKAKNRRVEFIKL